MKKIKGLNEKFITISLSLIAVIFVVMFVTVQIVAQVFTNDYLQNDVLTTHHTLNSEVSDVLDEVNFGYTRLAQGDLSNLLSGTPDRKQAAFNSLVEASSLSADYVNVVLNIDGDFLCTDDSFDLPAKSFGQKITSGSGILYLGEVNSDGGYLQLGRKFQSVLYGINGYVVFYLKISLLNDFCAQTDSDIGYMQILTGDYKIIARSDGQNIGRSITERKYSLQSNVFSTRIDGAKSLVTVTEISNQYNLDWYFVSVLDSDILQRDFNFLSIALAAIAVVCGVIVFVVAIKTAKATTEPINDLSHKISSVDLRIGA